MSSKHAVVLGCGMVGATMARDVAADPSFRVTACDLSEASLARLDGVPRLSTRKVDLSDTQAVRKAIADADVVLGALPSRFGFAALRTVIEQGKPYADISFMPQDALAHHALAESKQVTVVVDCGVSPGLSNMAIGYAASKLTRVRDAVIYVGGLPRARHWPFQYKAPFAPSDVIEEYTRPARMIEHGQVVTKAALSEPELLDFAGIGSLEAFNTDGLRSLLTTVPADNMKEKTLRYPGHCDLMRALRDTGFLSNEAIQVAGQLIRPLDVTAALMFPRWQLDPQEDEFTVMRVVVRGDGPRGATVYSFDLLDCTDHTTGTSSMARTTGFPCAIVARLLAQRHSFPHGVIPPERLAMIPGVFDAVRAQLVARGVTLSMTCTPA